MRHIKGMVMVMLTFLSFGLLTSEENDVVFGKNAREAKSFVSKIDVDEYELLPAVVASEAPNYDDVNIGPLWLTETFILDEATKQGLQKFGTGIASRIESSYKDQIIPALGDAVEKILVNYDPTTLEELAVSKAPAAGRGEKIMHIYNSATGEDLLRFHVRLDRPPKRGHYFQFHYHLNEDLFLEHFALGSIYWGKDEPPRFSA
ncbi:YpjP family protein [Shouchella shacheensis]|uniref:YpjP family protein n=1 Tax=Shouchella shacheensis TaxID=1649580 RepID=UPI000A67EDCB|nr:YpjP family protein [Shouchella shacheensis]